MLTGMLFAQSFEDEFHRGLLESRSIVLNPKVAAAHFQLARAYDKQGDAERARAERAEHERLSAAETGAGPGLSGTKDKPLP